MSNNIKIAISGKSGCGNSTVSRMVAHELGLRLINYTFHDIAEEKGIDFKELHQLAQKDLSFDRYLDRRQIELASEGECVLGSRLAIWLLEDAFLKVYLEASPEVRAGRIKKREGGDFETIFREMQERDERDRQRYIKLYDIDIDDYRFADLIINTDNLDQHKVTKMIVERVREKKRE
ncbi:MAG: cytidylate kinase [Spirochaetes bacterium]|nr:MAG: cytidylate kinase [Spirochaetota bacterium]